MFKATYINQAYFAIYYDFYKFISNFSQTNILFFQILIKNQFRLYKIGWYLAGLLKNKLSFRAV